MSKVLLSLNLLFSAPLAQDYTVGIPVLDTIAVGTYGIDTTSCSYDSLRIRLASDLVPYVTGLQIQVEVTSIEASVLSNVVDTVRIGDMFSLPAPNESGILTFYYPESNSVCGFMIEVTGTPLVEGETYYCELFSAMTLLHCHNTLDIDFNPDSICTVQPSASLTDVRLDMPAQYELRYNYPNPFNPMTTIEFSIPQAGIVTLTVYNVLGREIETIVNQHVHAGQHKVQWNASGVPSGIYFVRMQSADPSTDSRQRFTQTRKVMVLK